MLKVVGTSLSQLRSSSKAKYVLAVVVVIGVLAIIPLSVQLSQESREDRSSASQQEGTGVVSGTIYDDKNYNGVMDSGDPGLQKYTSIGFPIVIEMAEVGPTVPQPKITEAYADESGKYQFKEITFNPENTYVVRVKEDTTGQPQYNPSSSPAIKVKGPRTINFGFGSLTAIQSDVPKDTCVMNMVPPDPDAVYTGNMRVFVRTNPDLSYTSRQGDFYEYETVALAFGDKYGQVRTTYGLMRMQPAFPGYRQMVMATGVQADGLLDDPTAPLGQAPDEFNLKRNGRLDCALILKKGAQVIWEHEGQSVPFDVMEARLGEYYWNGATPTPAQGCSVDINANPANIPVNPPTSSTVAWTSQNVYGNCTLTINGQPAGTAPPKSSMQITSNPNLQNHELMRNFTITCKNADNQSCSDSTTLTMGSGSTNSSPTPFPTISPTPMIVSVATGSAVIALSPESTAVTPNAIFKVRVLVSSNAPINVAQTTISFPTSKVSLVSIDTVESAFGIKAQENVAGGVITIARATQTPVSGTNVLAELSFRPIAGPIPLTLSNGQVVSSANNQNLNLTYRNAIYSITLPTMTPTFTPTPTNTIFVDPLPTSTIVPQVRRRGDLNEDGLVNLNDLSILLNGFGTSNTTADLNGDGKVNIFDLSIILSQMRQ